MKKKPTQLYYEELGDNFDAFMSEHDISTRINLISKLLKNVDLQSSCLEIGCGTGRVSEMLTQRFDDLTVSDISEKLCSNVGTKLGVSYSASDACNLAFDSEAFDVIVSSECIEHTPSPLQAIEEMIRVLKPGGTLIFTTPNKLWFPALIIDFLINGESCCTLL